MNVADLLADGYGRIQGLVHHAVEGLTAEQLAARPGPDANSIGWLVWHLARVQDDHIADAAGIDQLWTAQGWQERFALPFPAEAIGYGHSSAEVAQVRPESPDLLTGYYDAVHEHTLAWIGGLDETELDRVVDEGWTPPVTLGVRLVSVLSDDLQHAGQAEYLRGLLLG